LLKYSANSGFNAMSTSSISSYSISPKYL
jgi:hypothetical protein